ncbi:hypothetical protein EVG20_g7906 [Dentipellis fragilis]|uniref:DBF4-type domain-containing protein n=1 Tax=Dentipellis fragilis TaxID=205917 RepID=A0A4Y9YB47_9AGAM|nr:hypothetical protein EVG20_g7906 [Dentipellis fragilis]
MATLQRRPLNPRTVPQLPVAVSPLEMKGRSTPMALRKRSRSPDTPLESQALAAKRVRASRESPAVIADDEKERRRAEREAQKEEFRVKYTRAFPSWTFYFDWDFCDADDETKKRVLGRLQQMGSRVEGFFSNEVTHFITNQSLPSDELGANKENVAKSRAGSSRAPSILKSPIRLKARGGQEEMPATGGDVLVKKAMAFNMKIWTVSKLESVMDRCQASITPASSRVGVTPAPATGGQRSLSRLLESERIHGTSERDPTQKRHDYQYFTKGSYFVLVEDMRQELATIHALEYPVSRSRDGPEEGTWPVLHCHPKARGPFVEYDEKEAKRARKSEWQEQERLQERKRIDAKLRERQRRRKEKEQAERAQNGGDLRRTVSMVNLKRRLSGADGVIDLDAEVGEMESANASGYLASGTYMAASGNSVAITSNTGTTSNASLHARTTQLPASLRGRLQQQVLTSRRVSALSASAKGKEREKKGDMGPPPGLPEKQVLLRKSKSTNTLRLPKREEGSKPGYCECCRTKFTDFNEHIMHRKHRKFAADDSNFLQLDYVLARVRRQTKEEVAEAEADERAARARSSSFLDVTSPQSDGNVAMDEEQQQFTSSASEVSGYLPPPRDDLVEAEDDSDIEVEAPEEDAEEDIDLDAEGEDDVEEEL